MPSNPRVARVALMSVALLLIASCGGGGGAATGPSAAILFPPGTCLATSATLQVRGVASAPGGVLAVSVNGVPAASANGFADWVATVPLSNGDNLLRVDVTSTSGVVALGAAQVSVRREGPIPQAPLDAAILPGVGQVLYVDPGAGLLAVNVASGARAAVSDAEVGAGEPAREQFAGYQFEAVGARVATNRAYVLDRRVGSIRVLAVELFSGDRSVLSDATHGAGPALGSSFYRALTVDGTAGALFLASSSTVTRVELATGDRTTITFPAGSGATLSTVYDLASDGPAGQLYALASGANTLVRIDLASLVRTTVSGTTVGSGPTLPSVSGLALDTAGGRAFVVSSSSLYEISLATGDRTLRSDATLGSGPSLPPCLGLAWEAAGQRVLAAFGTGGVMAIDPVTGNRTVLHEPTFGSGPFSTAEDLGAHPTSRSVYYLDRSTAGDGLQRLDLDSGVRAVVSDDALGAGPTLDRTRPLAVADDGLETYVAHYDQLLAVNHATGDRSVVSSAAVGTGPAFDQLTEVEAGGPGGRLVVLDRTLGMLLVDRATGNRTVVASLAALGGNVNAAGLGVDAARALAYVSNDDGGDVIYRVDLLVPGSVTTLAALDPANPDPFNTDPDGCTYDPVTDQLFVLLEQFDWLMQVDTQSDLASVASDLPPSLGPFMTHGRIQSDRASGVLYVSVAGGIVAVDAVTGQRVMVALVNNRFGPWY